MLATLKTRIWESGTVMTWSATATRIGSAVIILPLILSRFQEAEIAFYYLILTISSIYTFLNLGFTPTFTRLVGYAKAGLTPEVMRDLRQPADALTALDAQPTDQTKPLETGAEVVSTMNWLFLRITIVLSTLLAIVISAALIRPAALLPNPLEGWLTWVVVALSASFQLWGNQFQCYLVGNGQVALMGRWQTMIGLIAFVSVLIAIIAHPSLMLVVVVQQCWLCIGVLNRMWLCHRLSGRRYFDWLRSARSKAVVAAAWPSAWRSGLGFLFGVITTNSLGLIYAQSGDVASVTAFLLALRFADMLQEFSNAPFYSKLPQMNVLMAKRDTQGVIATAQRGIWLTNAIFGLGFIGLLLTGPALFHIVEAKTTFPPLMLWAVLGYGYWIRRNGALLLQIYSTTNHIVWHKVNLMDGCVTIVLAYLLIEPYGGLGLAIAIGAGAIAYTLGCAWWSVQLLKQQLSQMLLRCVVPFLILGGLAIAGAKTWDLPGVILQHTESLQDSLNKSVKTRHDHDDEAPETRRDHHEDPETP